MILFVHFAQSTLLKRLNGMTHVTDIEIMRFAYRIIVGESLGKSRVLKGNMNL